MFRPWTPDGRTVSRVVLWGLAAAFALIVVESLFRGSVWRELCVLAVLLLASRRGLKRPFFILVFLLPLHRLSDVTPQSLYVAAPLVELGLLCFFALWLGRMAWGRDALPRPLASWLPWLPFLALAGVSAVLACGVRLWALGSVPATSPATVLFRDPMLGPYFPVRALFSLVECFLLYLFVRTQLTHRDLQTLRSVVLASACLVMVLGLLSYFALDKASYAGVRRAVSTFLGPNELGTYLLLVLPLCALSAFQDRRVRVRLLALACAGVGAALLVLTRSEGAWLGAAAMLASAVLVWAPEASWQRRAIAATGVLALLGVAGGLAVQVATRSVAELNAHSDGRYVLFLSALNMVRASPLLGVGLGNFYQDLGSFYPPGTPWRAQHEHAHNMYLQLLAELGVTGLALWLWPFWRLLRGTVERARHAPEVRVLGLGLLGALVHSLTDYTLLIVPVALLFWMEVGMLEVALAAAGERVPEDTATAVTATSAR